VRDMTWWIAMSLILVDSLTFIVAMPTRFRARRGSAMLRLTLVASIAIGTTAVIAGLATRSTVPLVATALGALLAIGTQAMFWSAMRAHRGYPPSGAFASDPPVVVLRTGSYRWVRHPIYLAYIMAFTAGAIFAAQPWLWVVPLWMLVLYSGAAW
jgi:protein-S-isoprenylcysteine O-methyltransferase Ste14